MQDRGKGGKISPVIKIERLGSGGTTNEDAKDGLIVFPIMKRFFKRTAGITKNMILLENNIAANAKIFICFSLLQSNNLYKDVVY